MSSRENSEPQKSTMRVVSVYRGNTKQRWQFGEICVALEVITKWLTKGEKEAGMERYQRLKALSNSACILSAPIRNT